jgi:hypothetical protein
LLVEWKKARSVEKEIILQIQNINFIHKNYTRKLRKDMDTLISFLKMNYDVYSNIREKILQENEKQFKLKDSFECNKFKI